jgi:hypothetical protein
MEKLKDVTLSDEVDGVVWALEKSLVSSQQNLYIGKLASGYH